MPYRKEILNYKQIYAYWGTEVTFVMQNEQTKGLLHQFFPRYRTFKGLTQKDIEKAVALINHRPRKVWLQNN